MNANLIHSRTKNHSKSPSRSSNAARPALETLESRNLLDASSYVHGLYANLLQRSNPSDAEVNAWVSQIQSGVSYQAVSTAFLSSQERYAVVVNEEFTNLLNRPADPAASSYWAGQLANGVTQQQLETALASSEEFLMVHGSTNNQYVTGLYETILHREPDPAGLAYWNGRLAVTTNGRIAHEDVAARFVYSNEAHLRDVDAIFAETLHRAPSDGERAQYASALDQGSTEADVTGAVLNSPEYLQTYGVQAAQ
jgi:hypothetical protein